LENTESKVSVVKGTIVEHIAPPHEMSLLMKDLFEYLKDDEELTLIKSCVFHYEMSSYILLDGNGRMGRLWQTLILISTRFLSFAV
jgi:Fic family protein